MSEVSTEIVASEVDVRSQIAALSQPGAGVFSTFTDGAPETRKAIYNAVTDPASLSDHLGKTINLANVVTQMVEVANLETGAVDEAARVVLIDDAGKAYVGMSNGLLRSLQNLFSIIGKPGETEGMYPLPVKVVEEKSRKGYKFFTIKLA